MAIAGVSPRFCQRFRFQAPSPNQALIAAGVAGYFLRLWKFPVAPFIIGVVLGPTTENSLRQTLMMFRGDVSLVAERPVSLTLLALAAAFLAYRLAAALHGRKFPLVVGEDKTL